MRYLAAFDGGGSSTRCAVVDETGAVRGRGRAGALTLMHVPGGEERCRRAVGESLQQALRDAALAVGDVQLACLGMSGADQTMERVVEASLRGIPRIVFVHDSVTALEGALGGKPGIVVISGTGSVAFGCDRSGKTARAGGWGYLMGDEGSGYWIGARALSLATRSADGVGPPTRLARLIPEALGCRELAEVHERLYAGGNDRPEVARLTEVVARAAVEGDQAAALLLEGAGASLAELALAVARKLDFTPDGPNVSYAGGVFRAGDILLDVFVRTIKASEPHADVSKPLLDGLGGAVLLGLEHLGTTINDALVQRVAASLSQTSQAP